MGLIRFSMKGDIPMDATTVSTSSPEESSSSATTRPTAKSIGSISGSSLIPRSVNISSSSPRTFKPIPTNAAGRTRPSFFVSIEKVSGENAKLCAFAEILNDGLVWAREGTEFEPMSEEELYFIRLTHFGGWLWLNCTISGQDPQFRLNIQLVLKE